jgi:LytS/YehU family sensor histidine kinase
LQSENELLENQVSVMLSQIRPHFLYNTLVTIQELCLIDAQVASETAAEFSRYLRHNIDSLSSRKPIHFEKELGHIEAYLSIEKKRFEERLNVVYDISVRDFFLPALTLQPLVENAVRHGLITRWQGGTITISTKEQDGNIIVTITDDGVGFDTNAIGENSTGIRNVRARLAAICGGTLDIKSENGAGTTSTVTIPIRGLD